MSCLRRSTQDASRLLIARCAPRRGLSPSFVLVPRRAYAERPQSSPTRYEPEHSAENVQNEFVGHATHAFNNLRKVVAFTAYGVLILGLVTASAFEGAHFWIERQMRASSDEEARRWGWEIEGWTGGEAGGTSPKLGYFGRHAVRAAWFSLLYGVPLGGTASISQLAGSHEKGSLNVVDSDLESARVYIEEAMARVRDEEGRLRTDSVGLELLERHAAVLERIGSRLALTRAREEYLQVLRGRTGQRLAEARLAVKVGDLSERLGDGEGALSWWTQGIKLTQDPPAPSMEGASPFALPLQATSAPIVQRASPFTLFGRIWGNPGIPTASTEVTTLPRFTFPAQPPLLPAAQRTLVAAMLSLSAHLSKRKQLQEAKHVQEQAFALIDAMVPKHEASSPAVRAAQSLAQTLHHMYLLHRKSLLAIHHGEVTHAMALSCIVPGTSPGVAPLSDLLTAASSSEIVAQVLTGQPHVHPDSPSTYLSSKATSANLTAATPRDAPPSNANLLSVYKVPALSAPASSLLRDARLTATEAWDLCGLLYSEWGDEDADGKALECFERALGWAGEPNATNGTREGMGANEWRALWERYVEARQKVLKIKTGKQKQQGNDTQGTINTPIRV